jgi:hypothetical protein
VVKTIIQKEKTRHLVGFFFVCYNYSLWKIRLLLLETAAPQRKTLLICHHTQTVGRTRISEIPQSNHSLRSMWTTGFFIAKDFL